MAKSRRNISRDNARARLFHLRKLERRRILEESLWDREKAELVSLNPYYFHEVDPGDVLFDQRGHVHPSMEVVC